MHTTQSPTRTIVIETIFRNSLEQVGVFAQSCVLSANYSPGLPYFKFLNRGDGETGKKEFARLQREALENYLLGLIRAVVRISLHHCHRLLNNVWKMFHQSANRVAGFLEISALSISLAQGAGAQYKAGWLRIEVVGNKGGGFGRRSTTWREKRKVKWAAVRESYMVVLEDPGEVKSGSKLSPAMFDMLHS
jgi:phospholipase D1/2